MADFISVLRTAFSDNGVSDMLDERSEGLFFDLCEIMKSKNEEMNITAITDDDGISRKHFADCMFLARLLDDNGTLADIGCGGGFPSLPIGIVRPNISVTSIDSTEKKVRYVEDTAKKLGLRLVGVSMRAEEGAKNEKYRERYDVVTARAVAPLSVLVELCLPYVKVGGRFFSMKGKGAPEEIEASRNAVAKLGAEISAVHKAVLISDGEEQTRYIIEMKKLRPTPSEFPRQYAKIKKKPL